MPKQYFKVTKITKQEYYKLKHNKLINTSAGYFAFSERTTVAESMRLDSKTWLGYTSDDKLEIELEG